MSRRSTAGTPALVFSLALAFVVGSFALAFATPLPASQPNPDPQIADCSKATDSRHFTHEHPIKCAKTQKPCNGGCIEKDEECNPLIR